MADHFDDKTRDNSGEITEDDPLAELARIVGYDRPEASRPAQSAAATDIDDQTSIDLESELLRELESDQLDATTPDAVSPNEAVRNADVEEELPFGDDWLNERPEAISETVSADDADLPDEQTDTPDYEPFDFGDAPLETSEEPEVAEEALFEALEQELSISADELLPDNEPVAAANDGEQGHGGNEAEWDEAAWDELVGEAGGETAVAAAAFSESVPAPVVDNNTFPGHAGQGDADDILADMARFDIPEHGQPEHGSGDAGAQSHQAADQDVMPEDTSGDDTASFGASEPVEDFSFELDEPQEVASHAEPVAGEASFEEELAAGLDDFSALLDSDEMSEPEQSAAEETQPADGDELDELEVDFDDAAASFLNDEEYDLDLAIDESQADSSDFHADQGPVETTASVPEVPFEDVSGSATATPDDEIATAFSDLLSDDDGHRDADEEAGYADGGDADWPEYPPEGMGEGGFSTAGKVVSVAAATGMVHAPAAGREAGYGDDPTAGFDPDSEPGFDESEWLDALGIEDDADSGVPEDAGHGAGHDDGVVAFPRGNDGHANRYPDGQTHSGDAAPVNDMGGEIFDESAITETDETPGFIAEIDVPDLPVDEPQEDARINDFFDDDLDREFASLVEADTAEGHSGAWQQESGAMGTAGARADAEYNELETDLGLTGGEFDGPYRPRPVPVDADAALSAPHGAIGEDGDGSQGSRQGAIIAAAVLGLAVIFGGIAIGWSWLAGDSGNDGPRIIMADKDPVKVQPENPGGTTVPNQDKAVYDRVDGNENSSGRPSLNDSSEEPIDVVRKTIDPELLPLEGREEAGTDKVEARLTAEETDSGVSGSGEPSPVVSPRKVRTMIVRPDGTIVAREEPDEPAPVVPAVPETPVQEQAAAAPSAGESAPAGQETANETQPVEADASQQAPAETATEQAAAETSEDAATANGEEPLAPVRTVKTVTIRRAPVPQSRPADQPVNVVGQVSETGRVSGVQGQQVAAAPQEAAAPAAAAPAPEPAAPAAPSNPGGYYVQIASQPSAEAAQASYDNLSRRFSSLIGGRGVDIQAANIPNRGVFHRVRIPAGSRADANNLCARYKAAGGSCLVTR